MDVKPFPLSNPLRWFYLFGTPDCAYQETELQKDSITLSLHHSLIKHALYFADDMVLTKNCYYLTSIHPSDSRRTLWRKIPSPCGSVASSILPNKLFMIPIHTDSCGTIVMNRQFARNNRLVSTIHLYQREHTFRVDESKPLNRQSSCSCCRYYSTPSSFYLKLDFSGISRGSTLFPHLSFRLPAPAA